MFHLGMEYVKWEHRGQMDLSMWHNAQLGQEEPTHTDTQSKSKKGRYGGTLIANGCEPLYMEL